jgi:hypothetical protein|tara:strand:+ start:651 stop:851 length:201 start_codon:yes stop_codon:yes gene_type:complete
MKNFEFAKSIDTAKGTVKRQIFNTVYSVSLYATPMWIGGTFLPDLFTDGCKKCPSREIVNATQLEF